LVPSGDDAAAVIGKEWSPKDEKDNAAISTEEGTADLGTYEQSKEGNIGRSIEENVPPKEGLLVVLEKDWCWVFEEGSMADHFEDDDVDIPRQERKIEAVQIDDKSTPLKEAVLSKFGKDNAGDQRNATTIERDIELDKGFEGCENIL